MFFLKYYCCRRFMLLLLCLLILNLQSHLVYGDDAAAADNNNESSSSRIDQQQQQQQNSFIISQNDIDVLLKVSKLLSSSATTTTSSSDDDGEGISLLLDSPPKVVVNPFQKKKKELLKENNAKIDERLKKKMAQKTGGGGDNLTNELNFHQNEIHHDKKKQQRDDHVYNDGLDTIMTIASKMKQAGATTATTTSSSVLLEEAGDNDQSSSSTSSQQQQQQQLLRRELQTDTTCPFTSAQEIIFDPVGVSIEFGSTIGAPTNLVESPGCVDIGIDSPTVWYTFTTTDLTPFFITTCSTNTNFNTVISIYSFNPAGEGCSAFCLGQVDDHGFGTELEFCAGDATHSLVAILAPIQPDTYYVAVSGATSSDFGSFELVLVGIPEDDTGPPSPTPPSPTPPTGGGGGDGSCPLDDATEIFLASGGAVELGNTEGQPASLPTVEGCSTNANSPTVWYTFTPPTTGDLLLTTCSPNTEFDTVMTIFREGTGECSVACVGSNDDHGSNVEICSANTLHSAIVFEAFAGTTYYVAVSGFSASTFGPFQLLIAPVAGSSPPGPSQLPTPFPTPSSSFVPGPTPTPPSPTPFPTPTSSSIPGGLCPFDDAIPITYIPGGVTVSGDTTGSTQTFESFDSCGSSRSSPTVWYSFTVPAGLSIGVTTCSPNTSFDTYIAVYRADSLNNCGLICEGWDDDNGSSLDICSSSNLHSLVFVLSTTVDTYYVAVAGFGAASFGPFELTIFPDSDEPPSQQPVPSPTFPPTFPSPGTVVPTPSGGSASCPPVESASTITYNSAGASVIGTTAGAPATFFVPPGGDGCSESTDAAPTVWYTFTTPTTEDIVVTTCSPTTEFDSMMAVYRADPLGDCGLECVGFSDDHAIGDFPLQICETVTSEFHSAILFTSAPGETYYVAVTGFSSFETGVFELQVFPFADQPTSPPVEFECPLDSAIELTYDENGIFLSGTTVGSPANLPNVDECLNLGAPPFQGTASPTAWYKLTTDADSLIAVTTCTDNTSFNTVIAIFREIDLAQCSLACEFFNDDATDIGFDDGELCSLTEGHSVAFFETVPPADTYYIAISGSSPSEFGTFELFILPLPDETSAPAELPTLAPVSRPTPFPAPAPSPAPTAATTPNPTELPSAGVEMTIQEGEITIDVQPVPGPFDEGESTQVVEDGSESFFRSMFGDDPDQLVNVELLGQEVLGADGNGRRRRRTQGGSTLRLSLKVLATYEVVTEEEFQAVLEGFVTENPDMYIESIQTAEDEAGGQPYFSSLETAAVVEEKDPPPPAPAPAPAPTPAPAPAEEEGVNAAVIGGSVAAGVFALILLVVGVIFCKKKKSEDEEAASEKENKDDAVEEQHQPGSTQYDNSNVQHDISNVQYDNTNIQYDDANIQYDNTSGQYDNSQGPPVDTIAVGSTAPEYEDDITHASSIVFVAQGVKATADTKVGISLARRQQDGSEDIIILSGITDTSIFAAQGLREGMVVKRINDTPIRTVEEASAIIRDYVGTMTIEAELIQAPQVETFDA